MPAIPTVSVASHSVGPTCLNSCAPGRQASRAVESINVAQTRARGAGRRACPLTCTATPAYLCLVAQASGLAGSCPAAARLPLDPLQPLPDPLLRHRAPRQREEL